MDPFFFYGVMCVQAAYVGQLINHTLHAFGIIDLERWGL